MAPTIPSDRSRVMLNTPPRHASNTTRYMSKSSQHRAAMNKAADDAVEFRGQKAHSVVYKAGIKKDYSSARRASVQPSPTLHKTNPSERQIGHAASTITSSPLYLKSALRNSSQHRHQNGPILTSRQAKPKPNSSDVSAYTSPGPLDKAAETRKKLRQDADAEMEALLERQAADRLDYDEWKSGYVRSHYGQKSHAQRTSASEALPDARTASISHNDTAQDARAIAKEDFIAWTRLAKVIMDRTVVRWKADVEQRAKAMAANPVVFGVLEQVGPSQPAAQQPGHFPQTDWMKDRKIVEQQKEKEERNEGAYSTYSWLPNSLSHGLGEKQLTHQQPLQAATFPGQSRPVFRLCSYHNGSRRFTRSTLPGNNSPQPPTAKPEPQAPKRKAAEQDVYMKNDDRCKRHHQVSRRIRCTPKEKVREDLLEAMLHADRFRRAYSGFLGVKHDDLRRRRRRRNLLRRWPLDRIILKTLMPTAASQKAESVGAENDREQQKLATEAIDADATPGAESDEAEHGSAEAVDNTSSEAAAGEEYPLDASYFEPEDEVVPQKLLDLGSTEQVDQSSYRQEEYPDEEAVETDDDEDDDGDDEEEYEDEEDQVTIITHEPTTMHIRPPKPSVPTTSMESERDATDRCRDCGRHHTRRDAWGNLVGTVCYARFPEIARTDSKFFHGRQAGIHLDIPSEAGVFDASRLREAPVLGGQGDDAAWTSHKRVREQHDARADNGPGDDVLGWLKAQLDFHCRHEVEAMKIGEWPYADVNVTTPLPQRRDGKIADWVIETFARIDAYDIADANGECEECKEGEVDEAHAAPQPTAAYQPSVANAAPKDAPKGPQNPKGDSRYKGKGRELAGEAVPQLKEVALQELPPQPPLQIPKAPRGSSSGGKSGSHVTGPETSHRARGGFVRKASVQEQHSRLPKPAARVRTARPDALPPSTPTGPRVDRSDPINALFEELDAQRNLRPRVPASPRTTDGRGDVTMGLPFPGTHRRPPLQPRSTNTYTNGTSRRRSASHVATRTLSQTPPSQHEIERGENEQRRKEANARRQGLQHQQGGGRGRRRGAARSLHKSSSDKEDESENEVGFLIKGAAKERGLTLPDAR